MPAAARQTDTSKSENHIHSCPVCTQGGPHTVMGPFTNGSPNVLINSLAAIRQDDPGVHMICCGAPTSKGMYYAVSGSGTVFINGKAAIRKDDPTEHCSNPPFTGTVQKGSGNVNIGG